MKSADYWKKRAEARMDRGMAAADTVLDQLERAYAKASRELQGDIRRLYEKYGDEYGLSYADAIKYIDTSDFKDWRYTLEEYVVRIRETGDVDLLRELDTLATRARVTRLQTLETAIKVNAAELGQKGETLVTQLLGDTYENTYYRSAYDFRRGVGVGSSLEMLSPDNVAKAISYPWSGADYSTRIWKNAAALEASLRETITQGLIQGKDVRQMTAAIQNATGAGVYNAQRLVRTETAYMVEAAELRSYADCGVDEYEILVAEDERLCKKCGARFGDVHKVADARVAVNYPPFHSNCRCTTVAHFSEEQMAEWEKLGAETEQLSFADWQEKYLLSSNKGTQEPLYRFQESKNIRQASEYAEQVLGIPHASYKGADIVSANEWNKGLADSFSHFPELRDNFKFVGTVQERNRFGKQLAFNDFMDMARRQFPGGSEETLKRAVELALNKRYAPVKGVTYAQSWKEPYVGGVSLNSAWAKESKSFISSLQRDVVTKFHPQGTGTIRSVLDHEIGHQLDDMLSISGRADIKALFSSLSHDEMTDALSRYAWDNNSRDRVREFVAEVYSEYVCSPNPRETAQKVGKIIEEVYEQWKSTK
jgi:SPP1 gp7 family putative phage head morphogenesis protein